MKKSILLSFILFLSAWLAGQPFDYAVMVSVTVQESPPKLTFAWPEDPTASWYYIYRKTTEDTCWGDPVAVLDGSATQFIDTSIQVGQAFEYGFYKTLHEFRELVVVPNGTSLNFTIHDSWGDGICCQHGLGSYSVAGQELLYASGGEFGDLESTTFIVNGGVGTTHDTLDIYLILDVFGEETAWELTNLSGPFTVASGGPYEYHKFGHISAGIRYPAKESRGTVLLLVDDLFTTELTVELHRLEIDLIGDGWKVKRFDVNRTQGDTTIKSLILNAFENDSSICTILLFGHIPVPYSGNFLVGHPDHVGAWPADVYYAELDDVWTDLYVYNTNAARPANHNIPGDGKWDNTILESEVDLEVGRVDLYDMPAFTLNEAELLRRYLNKNHDFRHGIMQPGRCGLIDDNIGALGGIAPSASGLRSFSAMFGHGQISFLDYFTTLSAQSYLWSQGVGAGSYTSCSGVGTTTDFASHTLLTVFTMLYGSYFGDWDNTNNLLRAPLAAEGMPLTCCWSGAPVWHFHHMALGETIGFSTRFSQNNIHLCAPADRSRLVHTALMGDPTLHLFTVLPVSGLQIIAGAGQVILTWNPSPDATQGYHIFRAETLHGTFTRISQDPITEEQFTDLSPLNGNNVYMVRAMNLETSASGSFYNLSQGVIDSVEIGTGIPEPKPEESGQIIIYPNPSGNGCKIEISLPHRDMVTLSLFSAGGSLVRELLKQNKMISGKHSLDWDGRDSMGMQVKPGVYYMLLTHSNGEVITRKLVRL